MRILRKYVVFDAPDMDAEASFWAAVLGGTVDNVENYDPGTWRDVLVDGEVVVAVQHAPDHRVPVWPPEGDQEQGQQMHYDLSVARDDVGAAVAEVRDLGAKPLRMAPDPDVRHGFHVFADPAGHPFCICWG